MQCSLISVQPDPFLEGLILSDAMWEALWEQVGLGNPDELLFGGPHTFLDGFAPKLAGCGDRVNTGKPEQNGPSQLGLNPILSMINLIFNLYLSMVLVSIFSNRLGRGEADFIYWLHERTAIVL